MLLCADLPGAGPNREDDPSSDILRAMLDAVLVVDLTGHISSANPSALVLLGFDEGELVGRRVGDVFADDGRGIATTRLQRVQSGTQIRTHQADLVSATGELIPATVSAAAISDEHGVPRGIVLVARDLRELFEERRKGELRRDLIARTLAAQEAERKRIARELHDEGGQALTSLLAGLERLERTVTSDEQRVQVRDLQRTTECALEEIGRISRGLRPALLDDIGLLPALKRLASEFRAAHGVPAAIVTAGLGDRLPPEVELTIYRCVQETLTNVARHAQAGRVDVSLQRVGDEIVVVVEDDGVGLAQSDASGTGLGLASLRERAALLGGTVAIESEPGQGTAVYLRFSVETAP